MKKIILLALTALIMVGCDTTQEQEPLKGFNIVVIDSCEYLKKDKWSGYQGYGYFAHKGNCRFCKERDSIKWEKYRKELKELVIKLKVK